MIKLQWLTNETCSFDGMSVSVRVNSVKWMPPDVAPWPWTYSLDCSRPPLWLSRWSWLHTIPYVLLRKQRMKQTRSGRSCRVDGSPINGFCACLLPHNVYWPVRSSLAHLPFHCLRRKKHVIRGASNPPSLVYFSHFKKTNEYQCFLPTLPARLHR